MSPNDALTPAQIEEFLNSIRQRIITAVSEGRKVSLHADCGVRKPKHPTQKKWEEYEMDGSFFCSISIAAKPEGS